MLANQIHAAGSHEQHTVLTQGFLKEFFDTVYILHDSASA
jgi:hypothetical protein